MEKKRFLFVSLAGLIGDIAWQVVKEGHEVRYYIDATDEGSQVTTEKGGRCTLISSFVA